VVGSGSTTKEVLHTATSFLSPCREGYQRHEGRGRKEGVVSDLLFGSVPPRSAFSGHDVKQKSPCSRESITGTLDLWMAF